MKKLLLAFCILLSSFTTQAQVIVHFTPTGAGNQDGSSWANAKPGSQLAPIMRFYLSYVELWVAAGTYITNANVRDSSFFINSTLRVYGGFNGTETSITQRDWVANPTILSGDIGVQGDVTDNNYHVVAFQNADNTTVLDGFIIQDGNANVITSSWGNIGGGISNSAYGIMGIDYSSPKISNCVIRNNNADYGGGGMADFAGGTLANSRIDHCTFENNTSGLGGPGGAGLLSFSFAGDGPLSPVLEHCIFKNNIAQSGAGGIVQRAEFDNSGTVHIKNCTFENNSGINTGAIAISHTNDPYNPNSHTALMKGYIDSCTFTHNTSTIGGTSSVIGASYSRGDAYGHELHITNCVIDSNTSWSAPINIMGLATITRTFIEHCDIHHNTTQSVGGVNISSQAANIDSTYINNCLFYYTGKQGIVSSGARNGSFVRSFINNSTFYNDSSRFGSESLIGNYAVNDPGQATDPCNAYMYINNSIVWHYRPTYLTMGVLALKNFGYGTNVNANIVTKNSVVNMDNNTWPVPIPGFGMPEYGTNGGGNIGVYPKFRDTANFDFRLNCGSPAIDAGNNTLISITVTHDLDNHNRILNTTVDMGCYEVDTLPTPISSPSIAVNNMDITCTAGYNMQPDSVKWTFGDGQASTQMDPTHTYAQDGTYEVCLHIYTECGEDVQCDSVTITTTSINNTGNPLETITLYPNPAKNQLNISGINGTVSVKLSTLTGSVLLASTAAQNNIQLDISKLSCGMYVVELTSANYGRRTMKVVKE